MLMNFMNCIVIKMSKRQLSKIYPGTLYKNSREMKWFETLLKRSDRCEVCKSRDNLQPHHIIPVHVYDKMYFDTDNGAVLCKSCHDTYHQNYFPINRQTFEEFKRNYRPSKTRIRKQKSKSNKNKYKRKKHELSPLYSKIKINDFRKTESKSQKKCKRKKRRRNKLKRLNPIFLCRNLGSDNWDFFQKLELEREVLGDYCE